MPHDIKTLVQGYLQFNRSSKDHLPHKPGDSSFSKELIVTLTGGVRVAALHHAPGVFGKVALQKHCLGTLPCKNLQSNSRKESLRDLIQSSSLTWQSLCVSLQNPLCPAHLTMLLTLDQLSRDISYVLAQSLFVSCNFSITAETWDVWGSRCCSAVSRECTSRPPKTGSVWKFCVLVYAHIALWTCIFQGRLRWPLLMEGLSYLWTWKW